jgi:hypothetical protein
MAHEQFIERNFRSDALAVIQRANEIIAAYQEQGFRLTLRQLYYQFVARGLIPNKQTEYKRLGAIINDARLAGKIDWDAIEDRTRNVRTHASWRSPQAILDAVATQYRENIWSKQPRHIEVWIEKDALIGVIEPVCTRWRVPYFGCRGYVSQSEQYAAGKRFEAVKAAGRRPLVLYLGDHDPSGMDMTRDHQDRLQMFAWAPVEVRRLALNMDQIELYDPPPNPAKETDSRSGPYIAEFGESSWELDALEPTVIDELIDTEIANEVDTNAWDQALEEEEGAKEVLTAISNRYDEVKDFLENN